MVSERLVAWSKPIAFVCVVPKPQVHEEPVDCCSSNLHSSHHTEEEEEVQHEYLDRKHSSYRETRQKQLRILGVQDVTIPCRPGLLELPRRSTRKWTQPNTCWPSSLGGSNESRVVLPCIMRSSSHARLHLRAQNTKRGVGEPQKDFNGKHYRTKASTPPRVEQ